MVSTLVVSVAGCTRLAPSDLDVGRLFEEPEQTDAAQGTGKRKADDWTRRRREFPCSRSLLQHNGLQACVGENVLNLHHLRKGKGFISMECWAASTSKHPTRGRHCDADGGAHLRPCATSSCLHLRSII